MAVASTRYFTYSTRTGNRRRVPTDHAGSDSAAILYARATNASNVVREDGPISRPVIHMLWAETDTTPTNAELDTRYKVVYGMLSDHFPYAPATKVQAAALEIAEALS